MPSHNALTGADLHEPKGIAGASSGEAYIANGSGSGSWDAPWVTSANLNNENTIVVTYKFEDISTGSSQWVVPGIAGDITAIKSVLHGAITNADATISFEIGGTAVTDGDLTIAFSSSAAGDVDTSTPSANNTLTANQPIEIISDGGSTGDVDLTITFIIDVS